MSYDMHVLKTWPAPFQAIADGRKKHEVRKADRSFKVGDVIRLREWDPERARLAGWDSRIDLETCSAAVLKAQNEAIEQGYSGRDMYVEVTYVTAPGTWGIPEDICVFSFATKIAPSTGSMRAVRDG